MVDNYTYTSEVFALIEVSLSRKVEEEMLDPQNRYHFNTAQDIANHIAFHFLINNLNPSELEGFAHFEEDDIRVDIFDDGVDEW